MLYKGQSYEMNIKSNELATALVDGFDYKVQVLCVVFFEQ